MKPLGEEEERKERKEERQKEEKTWKEETAKVRKNGKDKFKNYLLEL